MTGAQRARARRSLFTVNVWPPMVDALTLVVAVFVLAILAAWAAQSQLITRLRARDRELVQLREDKARVERRLRALAAAGAIEVEDGKVILQGEILFDSGSDEVRPDGLAFLERLSPLLADLARAEPDQMILVGGHTDDVPISSPRFASNWELSTARAVAVARRLSSAGIDPGRLMAAGFGEHHPRDLARTDAARSRNRRIELLLVPIHSVASR